MHKIAAVPLMCSLLILAGCSSASKPQSTAGSAPKTQKAEKEEPVLYTGKPCFSRMVDQARRWSLDAMPIHVESELNSESLGHGGKSTIWKGYFVSPSRGKARIFTCSGSVLPDSPAIGISANPEMASSSAVPMFDPSFLMTDSDMAFARAQERGGAKLLEKDPKQPVLYSLDWDAKNRQLVWVVIYGTGHKDSKGMGVVDASTGKFLRASR